MWVSGSSDQMTPYPGMWNCGFFLIVRQLTDASDISRKCYSYSPPHHSTRNMFNLPRQMIRCHQKYVTVRSSGHSSKMHLVQSMAVTSPAPAPRVSVDPIEIARGSSHRTASLRAPSTYSSHTRIQAGRARQPMPAYSKPPEAMISLFLQASIILPTLDIHQVMNFSYPIVGFDTTSLNGAAQDCGMFFLCFFILNFIYGLQAGK
jgi:hypothetical protein